MKINWYNYPCGRGQCCLTPAAVRDTYPCGRYRCRLDRVDLSGVPDDQVIRLPVTRERRVRPNFGGGTYFNDPHRDWPSDTDGPSASWGMVVAALEGP